MGFLNFAFFCSKYCEIYKSYSVWFNLTCFHCSVLFDYINLVTVTHYLRLSPIYNKEERFVLAYGFRGISL